MNSKVKLIGVFVIGIVIGCGSILLILYLEYREASKELNQLDDTLQRKFIEMNLVVITQKIEFFKLLNGRYPNDLSEVRQSNNETGMYIDPYADNKDCVYEFYYYLDKTTGKYVLLSPGKDQKLFSEDDVFPGIDKNKLSNLGLLFEKSTDISYPEIDCYERD